MQRLLQRLVERRPVITDGAWGTELQARGLAIGEFSDLWNLSHAERVAEVAGAYIEAGSQIILTNTFGAKVRLHICGDTRHILEGMDKLRCDIVDLDSLDPLSEARRKMGDWQVPLGNMNPATILRDGGVEAVTQAVGACHRDAGARYIVGPGCEIPRDTPPENVRALAEYARSHQPELTTDTSHLA